MQKEVYEWQEAKRKFGSTSTFIAWVGVSTVALLRYVLGSTYDFDLPSGVDGADLSFKTLLTQVAKDEYAFTSARYWVGGAGLAGGMAGCTDPLHEWVCYRPAVSLCVCVRLC